MAKEAISSESIKSAITSTEAQRQQVAEAADTSKFNEVIENSKKAIANAKIGAEEAAARTTQAGIAEQQDIIDNPPKIPKKSGKKTKMVPDMNAVRKAQKRKANLQGTLVKQQSKIQELKGQAKTSESAAAEHAQNAAARNAEANQLDSQNRSEKAKLDDIQAQSQIGGGNEQEATAQVSESNSKDVSKPEAKKDSVASEKTGSSKQEKTKVDSGNHRF